MIRVNIVQNFNVENNIFRIFFLKSTNWFVFFCIWYIYLIELMSINNDKIDFSYDIFITHSMKNLLNNKIEKKNHWRKKFETKTWKISQTIFRTMKSVSYRFKSFFEKRFKLTHVLISSIEKFHICKKKKSFISNKLWNLFDDAFILLKILLFNARRR